MLLLIRSLLFQASFLLFTATVAILSMPLLALRWQSMVKPISRFWAHGVNVLLKIIAGIDCRFEGRENLPQGPFILAAKHQSLWDTSVVLALFDNPCIVIKQELLRIPVYGWFTKVLGMVPVDRDGGGAALKQMLRACRAAAEAGRVLIIFPQGTRTLTGEAAPYQPGVVAIYRETGLPVVPAALNSGFFWPKHGWRRPPGVIRMQFLEPIPPGLKREAFMAELTGRIETANARLEAETRESLQKQ
jgi:1-acyl-sn-glycerol-3-phosphate acyltransferase